MWLKFKHISHLSFLLIEKNRKIHQAHLSFQLC